MRECTVCGLTFLTGEVCPGCGSQVHQQLYDEPGDDVIRLDERGPLPGLETFMDSVTEVLPEEGSMVAESEPVPPPATTLPFGMGGDSVTMRSTLPFGVGSHSLPFETGEMPTEPPEPPEPPSPPAPPSPAEEPAAPDAVAAQPVPASISDAAAPIATAAIPAPAPPPLPVAPASAVMPTSQPLPSAAEVPTLPSPFLAEAPPLSPTSEVDDLEPEVVFHDFSQDSLTTVVEVDLDALVEDAGTSEVFDPLAMEAATEPELHPIKALAIAGLNDHALDMTVQSGFASMGEGDWDAAATAFHAVASSGRGGAAALNNYGLALLQKAIENFEIGDGAQSAIIEGQFEAAIFALRQAAQSEGQRSEVLYNLGIALHRASWHDKAMVVFDTLLQRDGPQTSVMNAKAVILESQGQFEDAKQLLRQAAVNSPQDEIITANLRRLTPI